MDDWLRNLLLLIMLIAAGGFFAAAGTAIVSVRRSRMRELADEDSRSAKRVLALLEDPFNVTAASHIAATSLWLLAAATAAIGPGMWLAGWLETLPAAFVQSHAVTISLLITITIVGVIPIVVGEIYLKSLAAQYAEKLTLLLITPVLWMSRLLRPLVAIVIFIAGVLLKPFDIRARFSWPVLSEEELMVLVEAGKEEGVIEEDEKEMIDSIFEFTDTVVRQVMVPRIDMKVVDESRSVREIVDEIMKCGHSRIPVYRDNVDSILGIIHAKDLLPILTESDGMSVPLSEIMRPAFFVPENKRVSELLAEFRTNNRQMAIVRDEYGGTAGLVTVEDLIEEIVGEIRDEYDQEEPLLVVHDGSVFFVDARMNIDDLNEQLHTHLPEEEFETIGGFVFGLLGKEPEVGDSVDFNGWRMTVESKEERRLRKIKLEPRKQSPDDTTTNGGKGTSPAASKDSTETHQSASG